MPFRPLRTAQEAAQQAEQLHNEIKNARIAATAKGLRVQQRKLEPAKVDVLMDAKPANASDLDIPNSAMLMGQYQ
jgi:hypothetical protein